MDATHMAEQQNVRERTRTNIVKHASVVEVANSLSGEAFFTQYLDHLHVSRLSSLRSENNLVYLTLDATNLTEHWLQECFQLIESTSKTDYTHSETKWKPASKLKEMQLPDMKYIILYESRSEQGQSQARALAGFISFMITYEDEREVIYIYEIHLNPLWQGRGLGSILMSAVESLGRTIGVSKVMLTVFRSNSKAMQWYTNLEYGVDEFSPAPRRMRNGIIKEATYIILSKMLQ